MFRDLALAALILAGPDGKKDAAPFYLPASIVNAASNRPGLAPNSFVSIYGVDLAYTTRWITPADIRGNMLPTVLIGSGVQVFLNREPAFLYYASPAQINLLVPPHLTPGAVEVVVNRDGQVGPRVQVELAPYAPALFQMDSTYAVATHADGRLVTEADAATGGGVVILYATGLGPFSPPLFGGQIPDRAAALTRRAEFRIWLNGEELPPSRVLYAGVAPGFAGLYQINVRLPEAPPRDPEVRIGYPEARSPEGVRLPVR
jgi:uncharacterized protein (TIGR03437 family)